MEHIVIREKDILKRNAPGGVWTEEDIRTYLERNGINFGQTTFVRGDQPNREWTNARVMFMPSDAQMAADQAERDAEEATLKASKARQAAEDARKDQEIADLKKQLERLSSVKVEEIPPNQESKTVSHSEPEPVGKDGMTPSERREAKIKSKARLVKPPKKLDPTDKRLKENRDKAEVAPVA